MRLISCERDLHSLTKGTFLLNIRRGFTQNKIEHIDKITGFNESSYQYINHEGKNFDCSKSSLFENFLSYAFDSAEEMSSFSSKYSYIRVDEVFSGLINGVFSEDEMAKAALHLALLKSRTDLAFRVNFLSLELPEENELSKREFVSKFRRLIY